MNNMPYRPKVDLIMPEYGRNVQQMVNICLELEDRAERNRCARTIINFMGNMFPYLRDVETFKHKLWDHLAIMSDFKLDIDYPFEIIRPEKLNVKPERVPYNRGRIRYMHYGRNIQNFVTYLAEHPDTRNHDELAKLIASHMKRSYMQFNKDNVENIKIVEDMRQMSDGRLNLDIDMKLYDTRQNNNRRYMQPYNGRQNDGRQNDYRKRWV